MALDLVHDVQGTYRRLVSAMAFPGSIVDLSSYAAKVDSEYGVPPMPLILGLIVLDAEVSFSVAGGPGIAEALSQITGARIAGAGEPAPFSFVLGAQTPATEILEAAPVGTLEDPQLGATVFLEVADLKAPAAGNGATPEGALRLSGPGIPGASLLSVGRDPAWLAQRREKNREYPLGIDLVLFTEGGHLVALPRTTQAEPS